MTDAALLRVLASLALVIVVMVVLMWLARRHGLLQSNRSDAIRILSSRRLGARSYISIVAVEDARLVLGVTPTQINLLHTLPPDAHSGSPSADPDATRTATRAATSPLPPARPAGGQRFRDLLKTRLVWLLAPVLLGIFMVSPEIVQAQTSFPALTASPANADGSQTWSLSVQTLVLLTMLSFLPALLLTMTGFTRIVIVLGLLRNAMGTGSSPPNSVIIGLALFLTFFAMSPVFDQVYEQAWEPLSSGQIELQEALQRGAGPMREFMMHQTRETDLTLFANMIGESEFESPEDVPLRVLVPAFVTSELKTAFQIGFTIFIPFLIIDLLVASTLMSLGMMMVPPVTISLPFKLMLFVLADGWHLLLGSLARSFHQ
ncbi:MAG TPA: flagellar type III secretion system pore protein FliP [Burkholderiaceae bacterium]|nr:flagellar type III secretion system pore protein FliP [Burkholderiaceae bacterium]